MPLDDAARAIALAAMEAVAPEPMIRRHLFFEDGVLRIGPWQAPLSRYKKIVVAGSGKAAVPMAAALETMLNDHISQGIVVSNYPARLNKIRVLTGSHPVPDNRSVEGAQALEALFATLDEDDLLIYLLSGGSSALIESPMPPVTLEEMQVTTRLLLSKSVPIEQINCVRKHLSGIKGGRLGAKAACDALVLVVSDVIGDDLDTIGSAPMYRDLGSYQDAKTVLEDAGLWEAVPDSVRALIGQGIAGAVAETPKALREDHPHFLVGTNRLALQAAAQKARELGFTPMILTTALEEEAREVAKVLCAIAGEVKGSGEPLPPPACLIVGGETTVTLQGKGKGGRNQEMALAALEALKGDPGIGFVSVGTDGIDGNSDAAGAVATRTVWERAEALGLSAKAFLADNDSYHFFAQTDGLLKTGPSGTNVMDVTCLLIS